MGSQANQLVVSEADVEPILTPAYDPTLVVQPGGQRPVFLGHGNLFDSALVGNGCAVDVTPPVVGGSWWSSWHRCASLRVWLVPAGRRELS
ncbi:MAG: hypothetical protein ACRDRA_12250, partial [Pseudonocardiaceae bacterium]